MRKTHALAHSRTPDSPRGFTLVEVLIALALGAIVLLPALALCSAALRESSRAQRRGTAFAAADALAWTAAANVRASADVPELRVVQNPVHTVRRATPPETPDAPWLIEVETSPGPDEAPLSLAIATFPPIQLDAPALPAAAPAATPPGATP
jgi:prepilin-type N-terminal cleavage/methylation domain-containing protein